ncbi:DsbA family protein [Nocardia abscessus]|uniref:DsbA family protein n=1 Tax=Nocardia abscessus TaxID=120957 RepID=UPI0005BAA24C|nr:thioredoxin domain-containing protein [Nocardia abscessus]MCC3327264.1 DsbA family protein [Nocardia abscessus]
MSKNQGGKSNPLLAAERADRNRKILIQVAVAAVLVALIAAIGIGIAVKKARKDDPGAAPSIAATTNPGAVPASITDSGAVRIGKPDAKVSVRVVADLQCPACKAFEAANGQVLEEAVNNGTAVVEYNVIAFLDKASTTRYSSRAGSASYCVAEADPSKYQDWLNTMFAQQPPEGGAGLSDDQLIQIAKSAGYTDDAVAQCITDHKYDKYIQARTKEVLDSGIQSTPSVFVDGKKVESSQEIFGPGGLAPVISAAAGQ